MTQVNQTKVSETKVKKTKVSPKSVFLTKVEMFQESDTRQKGPKKTFQVSFNGQTFFVVAHNRYRALGLVLAHLGGKVISVKAEKPENLVDILKGLSPDELKKVLSAIK